MPAVAAVTIAGPFERLHGYTVLAPPTDTSQEVLSLLQSEGAGTVLQGVDVRQVDGAGVSAIVFAVSLKPKVDTARFAGGVLDGLAPGATPQAVLGGGGRYAETSTGVRVVYLQRSSMAFVVLGLSGDRDALLTLTGALDG